MPAGGIAVGMDRRRIAAMRFTRDFRGVGSRQVHQGEARKRQGRNQQGDGNGDEGSGRKTARRLVSFGPGCR